MWKCFNTFFETINFFLFPPSISCRLILVTTKHLDYMDAALDLLGTLEKMQPCPVHPVLERSAAKCPQQHAHKFRWSKTRQWYLEAPHYLAWTQMWSTLKIRVPLQFLTVFPLQRASEKKEAVCEISVHLPPPCLFWYFIVTCFYSWSINLLLQGRDTGCFSQ